MPALGILLISGGVRAAVPTPRVPAPEKAPSKDKIQWLGSKLSLETLARLDYVGGIGATDLGNGRREPVVESDAFLRQLATLRCFRAFLLRGGLEWERFAFRAPDDALLPGRLHALDFYAGVDFRFSRRDMIRLQARPGFYTDFESVDGATLNAPVAMAYSRMVNGAFQWAIGVSMNSWRRRRWLGGGGFRWQINDRWKLKMMMPEPQIEYRAREDLHVFVGGDFRGDTYRVSRDFGTRRGRPALNQALVDYQEIRAGAGFSWNIKPLLELNAQAGYVMDRAFDYHENGILLASDPSPYASVNVQFLFEVGAPEESLETQGRQFEIPNLKRVLPNVPKIFLK